MLWSEVKKWAKENGYEVIKEKDDSVNGASYYWADLSNTEISGVSLSVSKLARDIYNSITSNQWIDHQAQYQIKLSEMEDIIYEG
jgi:hypothetical protein